MELIQLGVHVAHAQDGGLGRRLVHKGEGAEAEAQARRHCPRVAAGPRQIVTPQVICQELLLIDCSTEGLASFFIAFQQMLYYKLQLTLMPTSCNWEFAEFDKHGVHSTNDG